MKKQNESNQIESLKKQVSIYKSLVKIAADEKAAAGQIKIQNIELLAQLEAMKTNLISLQGEIRGYNRIIDHYQRQTKKAGIVKDHPDEVEPWTLPKDQRSFLQKPIDELSNYEIDLLIDYQLQRKF
jgi:hypothetical protein